MAGEKPTRIPVFRRDKIAAYVTVDPEDAERASGRWSVHHRKGYPYVVGVRNGRTVLIHRWLLGLQPGDPEVDHKNRDPLDNRRSNLRIVPSGSNQQNTNARRGSTSRYRGVSWNTKDRRWVAQACVNGQRHYLGYFTSEIEAAKVARAFRLAHMPFNVEPDLDLD